jgi:tetraacyldisaccharide 4'-kinase
VNLKTPRDWYQRDRAGRRAGLVSLLALAVSAIWARTTARRIARTRSVDPGIPVICVGNLTAGGVGKTPIVRELTKLLSAQGVDAQVLTRGHGGSLAGPVRVDPAIHTAAEVGDEALMLASDAPVWVARERVAGAQAAAAAGAAAIVMDDGHQNPSLRKVLSLVVVDGETRDGEWPFGDGRVVPAGPMREPLAAGLARADAVIILLPADLPTADPELLDLFAGKSVLFARLVPLAAPPAGPQVGFAGIGKPWKLERALKAAGCDLVDFAPLADHEVPTERFLAFLARRAETLGAGLVTTEKDWARLDPVWRERVRPWPVAVRFEDEAAPAALLASVLPAKA